MSTLIWFLTSLTLACSGLCELPAPVKLRISSRNFVHSLTWEPGPGSPAGLRYTVMVYSLWNNTWHTACELTLDSLCNLTGALPDPGDSYFAKVWATRGNQRSNYTLLDEAFILKDHMYLDPPTVSVSICGSSLCVALAPPSNRLLSDYNSFHYTLAINDGEEQGQYTVPTYGLVGEKIEDLEPGRKYCVTVTIVGRKSGSSRPQCVQSPAVYSADQGILPGVFVLVVVAVAVVLFLVYTGFICLKTTTPYTLVSVKPQDERLLPTSYDVVPYSLVQEKATSPPVAGGSKQENRRNSISEEDSDGGGESGGSGSGGYEQRLTQANDSLCADDSSPKDLPQIDSHLIPHELADHVSLSLTDRNEPLHPLPLPVTTTGPLPLPVTTIGPLPLPGTTTGPLPLPGTTIEPLPLPGTIIGPLPLPGTTIGPLPLPMTTIGPLPLPGTTTGPLPLFVDESRPFTGVGKADPPGTTSPKTVPCAEEEEEEEKKQEQSPPEQVRAVKAEGCRGGLNVNLLSVMLAGQGEKEKEEEEQKKKRQWVHSVNPRPLLLGGSLEPSVPLLSPPRLKQSWSPLQTQLSSVCTEEEEEEEEEEDYEEEGCSGYMSRSH